MIRLDIHGLSLLLQHYEAWQIRRNVALLPFPERTEGARHDTRDVFDLERALRNHCRDLQLAGSLPDSAYPDIEIWFDENHHLVQGDLFFWPLRKQAGLSQTVYNQAFFELQRQYGVS
jgi:hypothetical protein